MSRLVPRPALPGHRIVLKDGRTYRTATDRMLLSRKFCSCGCGQRIHEAPVLVEWDYFDICGARGISFYPYIRSHYDDGRRGR